MLLLFYCEVKHDLKVQVTEHGGGDQEEAFFLHCQIFEQMFFLFMMQVLYKGAD